MIFWIVIAGFVITAIVLMYLDGKYGDFFDKLACAGISLLIWAFIGLIVVPLGFWLLPETTNVVDEYDRDLRALGTSSTVDGQFYFLGGGYVDGSRTLNYIYRDDDGGTHLTDAYAHDSVIFEDTPLEENPNVEVTVTDTYSPWTVPWVIDTNWHYEFHIPENSVQENYQVTNK